jgi:hypothetical protein
LIQRLLKLAIASVVLACASSDGIVKNEIMGGPGQDIAVGIVDLDTPLNTLDTEGTRQYTVHIEVTNMTHGPLTVEKITNPPARSGQAFQVQGSSRLFNEMIDGGQEHVFQIPLRGRLVRSFHSDERRIVEFDVIVVLTNNDSYQYTFEGPVQDVYSPPR